jgi:hypothetical protein
METIVSCRLPTPASALNEMLRARVGSATGQVEPDDDVEIQTAGCRQDDHPYGGRRRLIARQIHEIAPPVERVDSRTGGAHGADQEETLWNLCVGASLGGTVVAWPVLGIGDQRSGRTDSGAYSQPVPEAVSVPLDLRIVPAAKTCRVPLTSSISAAGDTSSVLPFVSCPFTSIT